MLLTANSLARAQAQQFPEHQLATERIGSQCSRRFAKWTVHWT